MTLQPRHAYILSIFEKLGTPLLTSAAEGAERDRLMAVQNGNKRAETPDDEEAERLASLLKSTAEMGFSLSRNLDLRMTEPQAADGVRLTLAAIAAPLVANLYRVHGRVPGTGDIDRMSAAMQAVTLFADNYNAAADANVRLQALDLDFVPADGAQVQLMLLQALMPAMNAVCTFSFGQPEKNLLQDVIDRLRGSAHDLRSSLFSSLSERDGLRAEISLLRAAAAIYAQAHFTEMSKLMFLDDEDRASVDLGARLAGLWDIVMTRLSMLRVMAEIVVTGTSAQQASSAGAAAPAVSPVQSAPAPVSAPPQQPAAVTAPPAAETKSNPMSFFAKPKESAGA